ncbi:MAG TPA: Wzz/FepE/Etk N-terminal domain-containing protein [Salinivirgaceae bacterium]|nr:Wzz/FepE/Etk N-terminal domain-containing protein [Salinivirgaceae bacterium]
MPGIPFLIKYWKVILITGLLGAISALIVSLIIPPSYTSTVTLFPTKLTSTSQIISEERGTKDFMALGEEEELEQLQQVLLSDFIRDKITQEFQLMNHYRIDSTTRFPYTKLKKRYQKNVEIRKTRFQSIEINVSDESPEMAAQIANRITDLIDTTFWLIQKERADQALRIVAEEYNTVTLRIKQIEDSLQRIREKGINNYRSEAEVINAAYAEALAKGNTSGAKLLEQKIQNLSKYGGASLSLLGELELEQKRQSFLRDRLAAAQINAVQIIPRKYVVNRATPSEKKSSPVVWLNTILGFFALAITSSLIIALLDKTN